MNNKISLILFVFFVVMLHSCRDPIEEPNNTPSISLTKTLNPQLPENVVFKITDFSNNEHIFHTIKWINNLDKLNLKVIFNESVSYKNKMIQTSVIKVDFREDVVLELKKDDGEISTIVLRIFCPQTGGV